MLEAGICPSRHLQFRLGAFKTPILSNRVEKMFDRAEVHRLNHVGISAKFVCAINVRRVVGSGNNDDRNPA